MTVDKFTALTPELHRYAVEHSSFRDDVVAGGRGGGARRWATSPLMQIAGDQAALITILVAAIGARRALEVGTFLGYGALAIARGLPDGRRADLLRARRRSTPSAPARTSSRPGSRDRVEIRVGPALETLAAIDEDGAFDFAFVDADKTAYPDYYEQCLRAAAPGRPDHARQRLHGRPRPRARARRGRRGSSPSSTTGSPPTTGSRSAMLGVADGITLARKR